MQEVRGKGAPELVTQLFIRPTIAVREAAKVMGVSEPTAAKTLGLLVEKGHLREITGRAWGLTYVAQAVLDAVERPTV